jgi:hypothetical protein
MMFLKKVNEISISHSGKITPAPLEAGHPRLDENVAGIS